MLTPANKVALKTAIQADSGANAFLINGDLTGLANYLNTEFNPAFWCWRTDVSRADIYTKQNDLPIDTNNNGFWNWTIYKNQSVSEQNAWVQMFMGDLANFSQFNLRDGIGKIFTGSAAANAQRDHCLAIGRRKVTWAEKVLAVGAGTTVSPATFTFEGIILPSELVNI